VGSEIFQRGVTNIHDPGDATTLISNPRVRLIYASRTFDHQYRHCTRTARSGSCQCRRHDHKHFVLAERRCCKIGGGVALILRQILQARPKSADLLIDPHSEYGRCFGDQAQTLRPRTEAAVLVVQLREIVDVFFRRPAGHRERWKSCANHPAGKANYRGLTVVSDRVSFGKTMPRAPDLR